MNNINKFNNFNYFDKINTDISSSFIIGCSLLTGGVISATYLNSINNLYLFHMNKKNKNELKQIDYLINRDNKINQLKQIDYLINHNIKINHKDSLHYYDYLINYDNLINNNGSSPNNDCPPTNDCSHNNDSSVNNDNKLICHYCNYNDLINRENKLISYYWRQYTITFILGITGIAFVVRNSLAKL